MFERGSGILLHITSLPSAHGIGDIGKEAYKFADFLSRAGQKYWQILPLNRTDPGYGNSPYSSISALAGNPLLISPDLLAVEGLLSKRDLDLPPEFPVRTIDYYAAEVYKYNLLDKAYENFTKQNKREKFNLFCSDNATWLNDYSHFVALKGHCDNQPWNKWPKQLRDRDKDALEKTLKILKKDIEKEKFLQFIFYSQWQKLKNYCNKKKIRIFGDMPIYVNYDSADVWSNSHLFKLDKNRKPTFVAGVPPDYFSSTGQLWGNPVYNWKKLKETDFGWWIKRMEHTIKCFDIVRIDHFRGLVGYWQVPSSEKTAINGKWVKAPADDLILALKNRFPELSVVAEDLGTITPDVKETMKRFDLPGMKILLFAFGEDNPEHPYLPENYETNSVVYTGTHDNNTVKGWYRSEADNAVKERINKYLKKITSEQSIHLDFINLAMNSKAVIAITPLQDLLGLDESARMNTPSTVQSNWSWRAVESDFDRKTISTLLYITRKAART